MAYGTKENIIDIYLIWKKQLNNLTKLNGESNNDASVTLKNTPTTTMRSETDTMECKTDELFLVSAVCKIVLFYIKVAYLLHIKLPLISNITDSGIIHYVKKKNL